MVRDRGTAAAEGSVWGRLKTPSLVIRLIFLRLVCLVVLSEGSVNAWCPLIFVTTCFLICSSSALNLKKKHLKGNHLQMLTWCQLVCLTFNVLLFLFCSLLGFFFNTEPNKRPSHVNMRYSSREAKRSSRPCFANFFGQTTSCRDSATQLMLFKSRGVFNASLPGSPAQFHFIGVLYTSM